MALSLYSILGIFLFVILLVSGITLKIILLKRRNLLDGCDGFMNKQEEEDESNWEEL